MEVRLRIISFNLENKDFTEDSIKYAVAVFLYFFLDSMVKKISKHQTKPLGGFL